METEDARAKKLEDLFAQEAENVAAAQNESLFVRNQAIMKMETVGRESLEARISAMLVRKKYYQLFCTDNRLPRELNPLVIDYTANK